MGRDNTDKGRGYTNLAERRQKIFCRQCSKEFIKQRFSKLPEGRNWAGRTQLIMDHLPLDRQVNIFMFL